ncbi:MAG: hypothetical protein U9O64_05765 [Campylobacterota bacterium]|nr:hypothetical protein [Campylobacterota bacterium]
MQKIIMGTLLTSTLAISGGDIAPIMEDVSIVPQKKTATSSWKHSLSIYGWLPSLDGRVKYTIPGDPGDPTDPDKDGESSLADKIDMVFMGSYEARKDQWSFLLDAIYLGMSDNQEVSWDIPLTDRSVTAGSDQELAAWLLSGYGGYTIFDMNRASLDIIAGVRYLSLELDISVYSTLLNSVPKVSPSVALYDGVVGIRGHFDLSENWYLPYMVDIGAGDSDLTWQGEASIGYRFSWGDILATYRYVHYEKEDLRLLDELDLYGPKIGVVFHF